MREWKTEIQKSDAATFCKNKKKSRRTFRASFCYAQLPHTPWNKSVFIAIKRPFSAPYSVFFIEVSQQTMRYSGVKSRVGKFPLFPVLYSSRKKSRPNYFLIDRPERAKSSIKKQFLN